jgi:ABC-type dipeptide/oligopeptide/nickel transport system ATPase subunit
VLPSLTTQKKISDFLDVKCAEIDALIAAKEKTNALLKERRQSIIYEAVTKGLTSDAPMKDSGIEWIGEIPEDWSVGKLGYFIDVFNGDRSSNYPSGSDIQESGVPFLTSSNLEYDVLDMSAEEGYLFFSGIPKIERKLKTLCDVGLGYIKIGQSSTTISGGEAQRVKLATELSKRDTGRTIYILDEPTTGLHSADVRKLIDILQRLCEGGNTVLVIEHNLDVIKTADYIIDMGPEGGDGGGTVVATGTPEAVSEIPDSYTGQYLKKVFEKSKNS